MDRVEVMYELQELLAKHYSLKYSRAISREDIFNALALLISDQNYFEWSGDLWDIDLTYEKALETLLEFDFDKLKISVEIPNSVFSDSLLIERKARFKRKGEIWVIHKYDADPFPSNPHAHQIDNNIKLDLSNGKCYKVRKLVEVISKKDLLEIRLLAKSVFNGELPEIAV